MRTERYIATQTYVPLFIKAQYQTSEVQDTQTYVPLDLCQSIVYGPDKVFQNKVIPLINFDSN